MLAQVAQAHVAGERILDDGPDTARDQHLAAVRRGGDARRPVDVDAHVLTAHDRGLARVESDPDPERSTVRPGLSRERLLGVDAGGDRAERAVEQREEGVAHQPQLATVVRCESTAHQLVMPGQRARVALAERLQQARRAFDVAEEEGGSPGWTRLHGAHLVFAVPARTGSGSNPSSAAARATWCEGDSNSYSGSGSSRCSLMMPALRV